MTEIEWKEVRMCNSMAFDEAKHLESLDETKGFGLVLAHLSWSHIDSIGGYDYPYEIESDGVLVGMLDASKDYNRVILSRYRIVELRKWQAEAIELFNRGFEMDEAIWETQIQPE